MNMHSTRVTAAAIVLAAVASAARAGEIPSYYEHLDFNLTSPTAFTHAAGGFVNPSVYPMMPGGEIEFYWTDYDNDAIDRWGLFTGVENLGFGVVHDRLPGSDASVTDYRLALAGGTRRLALGLGYGWSGGDTDAFGREDMMQGGLTWRFNRYLSLGAVEEWGLESGDRREVFDAAVRPLGNDRVTLFGDLETNVVDGDYDDTLPWSAGAMLEIPAGLKLIGRVMDSDQTEATFSVAVAYSFGGGFHQGVARGSFQERFDADNEPAVTTWGVRLGYPERSELTKGFHRNSGYLEMRAKGSPVYTTFRFFDSRTTLRNILDAIDDARTDERIAGIALNLSGSVFTRGQAWEIRRRLGDFRATGKKVVVFIDEANTATYYVASIADRIVMDNLGLLMIPGYVIGRTYVASMLEKLGVGFEEFRFLEYKSAVENLARHEMSEADREQRQALVDEYYRTFRDDVAEGRGVSAATVDGWVNDQALFTANMALERKLVDELGRWDEVKESVKKLEGERKVFVGSDALADRWYPSKQWGETDKVAVVYAIGACDMDGGINARRLEKTLRNLGERDDVKAVVVRVDSPGGSAMASDVVGGQMRALMKKKPVVVSQGDVAASGGYWISVNSHQIVAQPTTITGSIGVIAGWAWDKGLGKKVGMEGGVVQQGKHADLFFSLKPPYIPVGIPHRAVTEEERAIVLDGMKSLYTGFVESVAKDRKMTPESVEAIAQGRVWTGLAAKQNGLVDRIGGLQDAILVAKELALISPYADVDIVDFAPRGLIKIGTPIPGIAGPLAFPALLSLDWSGLLASRAHDDAGEDVATDDYTLTYLRHMLEHNGRPQCMLPPDVIPRDGE
jgi:protease-4